MLKRDSQEYFYLLERRPTAFALLSLIAVRAKRTVNHPDQSLQIGEAFIGDHLTYGVSEREYRTDKKYLEKYGLVTFKGTKLGTIARLVNAMIFDINPEIGTNLETDKRRLVGEITTTNNNEKNDKNENKRGSFTFTNKITKDPDYQRLQELKYMGDGASVMKKMALEQVLASRYPLWKYQRQWDEAKKNI